MKKKFETTDIEHFFQLTNKIAPIFNEEKVHQIINSPEAPARLKGKPKNLLKFTIMTTLFAIIISAFLFWPDTTEEIPNSNDQIGNKPMQMIEPFLTVKEIKIEQENNNSVHDNKKEETQKTEMNEKIPDNINEENLLASIIEKKERTSKKATSVELKPKYPDSLKTIDRPKQEYVYPEQILDSTRFIELSIKELEKFGLKIEKTIRYEIIGNNFSFYFDGYTEEVKEN